MPTKEWYKSHRNEMKDYSRGMGRIRSMDVEEALYFFGYYDD